MISEPSPGTSAAPLLTGQDAVQRVRLASDQTRRERSRVHLHAWGVYMSETTRTTEVLIVSALPRWPVRHGRSDEHGSRG